MFPSLPSKFPHLLISLGIALMILGYFAWTRPFTQIKMAADQLSDLLKSSNSDLDAYQRDSVVLVQSQLKLIEKNNLLISHHPDSTSLIVENNYRIAERELALHEFFQKYRPKRVAKDLQSYINGELKRIENEIYRTVILGFLSILAGAGLAAIGLTMGYRDYKKEQERLGVPLHHLVQLSNSEVEASGAANMPS